jgi:hypothetical protein
VTAARLKRLAKLEARQPAGYYWRDPYPLCMRLCAAIEVTWAAERAGRPFSRLPVAPLAPEAAAQLAVVLRDSDMMHARLANEQEEART